MLKLISLFAGIGGIDYAFSIKGFQTVWANEFNQYAVKTYRHNFAGTDINDLDIRHVAISEIPDADILVAGFPCQSFSIMGSQKGFLDPRGTLFFEILRVLKAKLPSVIFLENVENILFHDNGNTLNTILNSLNSLGYNCTYKIMCPTEYANIPQIRRRFFLVGFLSSKTKNLFEFPVSSTLSTTVNSFIDRSERRSDFYYYQIGNKYYSILQKKVSDKNAIYRIDDFGIANQAYHICPTLKANMGTYPDRVPIILDDYGIRKLTPIDCLALQGFPTEFKFTRIPINEAYKQIGNSVCVPVVSNIAQNIKKAIDYNP